MAEFRAGTHRSLAARAPCAPDPGRECGGGGGEIRGGVGHTANPQLRLSPLLPTPGAAAEAPLPALVSWPPPGSTRPAGSRGTQPTGGARTPARTPARPAGGGAGGCGLGRRAAASLLPLPEARGGVPGRAAGAGAGAGPGRGALGSALAGSAGCARPLRLQAASARGPRPPGSSQAAAAAVAVARGESPRPSQLLPGAVHGDAARCPLLSPPPGPGPAGAGVASDSDRPRRSRTRAWPAAPAAPGLRAARGPRRPRGSPRPGCPVPGSGRPDRHGSLPGAVGPARHAGKQQPGREGREGCAGRGGSGELGGVNTAPPPRCPFRGRAGLLRGAPAPRAPLPGAAAGGSRTRGGGWVQGCGGRGLEAPSPAGSHGGLAGLWGSRPPRPLRTTPAELQARRRPGHREK